MTGARDEDRTSRGVLANLRARMRGDEPRPTGPRSRRRPDGRENRLREREMSGRSVSIALLADAGPAAAVAQRVGFTVRLGRRDIAVPGGSPDCVSAPKVRTLPSAVSARGARCEAIRSGLSTKGGGYTRARELCRGLHALAHSAAGRALRGCSREPADQRLTRPVSVYRSPRVDGPACRDRRRTVAGRRAHSSAETRT